MKFYKLMILGLLLQSCYTVRYSLTEYKENNGYFLCENKICSRGVDGGQSDMEIFFSEVSIRRGKICAIGTVKDLDCRSIEFCNIYSGKKIENGKIFMKKHITITKENGSFEFKAKLKEEYFIIFYTVGFRPKIYQVQNTAQQLTP